MVKIFGKSKKAKETRRQRREEKAQLVREESILRGRPPAATGVSSHRPWPVVGVR